MGSLLLLTWFVSGIVLVYAGMPALDPADRLARLSPLDLSTATVGGGEVAVTVGLTPRRILVGMLGERPVYRLAGSGGWTTVFADTGEQLDGLSREAALGVARQIAPAHADTAAGRRQGRGTRGSSRLLSPPGPLRTRRGGLRVVSVLISVTS